MGGEREVTVESKSKSKSSGAETKVGTLRIHESAGQVHFHDDEKKLKCAVPVADWWKAWEKLSCQSQRWEWIDSENNTILVAETQIQHPNFDLSLILNSVTLSPGFQKLNSFTRGK
jgi:hypothetical protein